MDKTLNEIQQNQILEYEKMKEHDEMLLAARAKIMKGIAENNNRSGERAIWELMQNARDLSEHASVRIELNKDNIVFSHQGEPFTMTTLRNLIKQQSTKSENADTVGQYGTGFMTTHVFSRKVYVSGECKIEWPESDGTHCSLFVPLPLGFCLDRSSDDELTFIREMDKELKSVEELVKRPGKDHPSEWTSFKYELSQEKVTKVKRQIDITTRLMPYVLVFNDRISRCSIINNITGDTIIYSRQTVSKTPLSYNPQQCLSTYTIKITENEMPRHINVRAIESYDGRDRIVIPPLPVGFDDVSQIPSHFLYFPMLGTEQFGTNFIFHSSRLYPTEKRNSFQLPEDNDALKVKYSHNTAVLDELYEMLFDFYRHNIEEQRLPLEFAKVSFLYEGDDVVTTGYYEELQHKFSSEFVKWKMIPTANNEYHPISAHNDVLVLHQDIFKNLTEDQRALYIPIISKYATNICKVPAKDLIQWSDIVFGWAPMNDNYYLNIERICSSINNKTDELKIFLKLLKDLGVSGEELAKKHCLIPCRNGRLRRKVDLRNGASITQDLFQLASPLIDNLSEILVEPDFADIFDLPEFTRENLRDELGRAIDRIRATSVQIQKPLEGGNESICALLNLCSAFPSPSPNDFRARLIPLIARIYEKEFVIQCIPSVVSGEADMYSKAFDFLLDNTMLLLSQKPSTWLTTDTCREQNKQLLMDFITTYNPLGNQDRTTKMKTYGIFPNQLGEMSLPEKLRRNISIDEELLALYQQVFSKDLRECFVDESFSSLFDFTEYLPKEVGNAIEERIMDKLNDCDETLIILQHLSKDEWKGYFPTIEAKEKELYYSHGSDEDRDALFKLQMQGSDKLQRLAQLSESNDLDSILNKAESLHQEQKERERQFNFTFAIGKLIENEIRQEISTSLTLTIPNEPVYQTSDVQYGQDIVISHEGRNLFFIECKAKWNFNEPAHMSSLQMKQAVRERGHYAVCCIDCTGTGCTISPDASQEEVMAAHEIILANTYVLTDVGERMMDVVSPIISHEDTVVDEESTIRMYSNLSCNLPKKVFVAGQPFSDFMSYLKDYLKSQLNK